MFFRLESSQSKRSLPCSLWALDNPELPQLRSLRPLFLSVPRTFESPLKGNRCGKQTRRGRGPLFNPGHHPKVVHSCTRVQRPSCHATRVALHMSQQISLESCGFSGVAAVSCYTPKRPVAPVALQLPGVSHVKLPLKRCRATGGVALHCATMV